MKPVVWKNLIPTILLAVTPSCLWGADLNVRGNINVQGDGTAASPGDLTVYGKLNVDGGISTDDGISVVGGTITVPDVSADYVTADYVSAGSISSNIITAYGVSADSISASSLTTVGSAFGYIFQYFTELSEGELGGNPASSACDLGAWDLCFLSEVRITGEDDQDSDIGECKVTSSQDKGQLTARPKWTLWVFLGNDVNNVRCAAYCLSFATICTGNCRSC